MKPRLNSLAWLVLALAPLRAAGQTSPWLHFTLAPGGPLWSISSTIYDPGSDSLILFGGNDIGPPCCSSLNTTWVLANASATTGLPTQWQQLSTAGTLPQPRSGQSAVYDQAHNRMIIFAGGQANSYDYGVLFNDVCVLTHANGIGGTPRWIPITPLTPNGAPAPREGHVAVYDPSTNHMTIFGGGNNGSMDVPNDVWVLTDANGLGGTPQWIPLTPSGAAPAAREGQIETYSIAHNTMMVFGGCCPSTNDLWTLSDATDAGATPAWQQFSEAGQIPPPIDNYGSYGYDPEINTLILVGGEGYNPEHILYNGTWMLTDADDLAGAPTWINTIPNGSPGSPPATLGIGGYDPVSKRLMALLNDDATDFWVMTTRNGIDVSCSAGVPTATQLAELQRSGIQYTVVEAPQYDSGECPGVDQIATAQQQLDAFAGAGFETAAYCFLYFQASAGTGSLEAQNCLSTIQSSRLSTIAFVALEGSSALSAPNASTLISQAAETIVAARQRPIIYTSRSDWNKITHQANAFSSYPLWITGAGVPSLTPFTTPFGGWTILSGRQYNLDVRLEGIKPVNFDVFDPALFQ